MPSPSLPPSLLPPSHQEGGHNGVGDGHLGVLSVGLCGREEGLVEGLQQRQHAITEVQQQTCRG